MKRLLKIALLGALLYCGDNARAQIYAPSDPQATPETRFLFASMQRLQGAGVMFGHHDDTAYGVGWKFDANRSDVKSVTGAYPAIYGWDFARLEHNSKLDINGTPFKLQRKLVQQAYRRGGINTFCWHMDNPFNDKTAWDTTHNSVKEILPGGSAHAKYIQYLDHVAGYVRSLKGDNGEAIPILFRPFHELTGNWFWWCRNTCTPDEFKELWRFTVDYLRQQKKIYNFLIVYSVADFDTKADFLARYPGDAYVDFIGFDNYCYKSVPDYQQKLGMRLALQQEIAAEHHKVTCLAETGYEQIPMANWWTTVLLPELQKNNKTAYVLAWRNGRPDHYYTPYPGQVSEQDFVKFFNNPVNIFQNRLTPLAVYGHYILPEKVK
ncbi:beta-mannosidase [Mucilaginibacter sp. Bleaf8]|uniref:glycoside hydrolase family 26 protein n=1 Tax=Mucilaginibacter sp. Bleaf8 TaxID=2834430 RepID=UPI001BCE8906|nr:glycosyl hydrolase [Mucilaginibacter sp. Bleaf8]MBS7566656.1 beta-mannosidase [Mucilaginibacter sp. Bleaf8]